MSHRQYFALLVVLVPCALLFADVAVCGDEDERPPYLIYVDPVTGKYTTEPPLHEGVEQVQIAVPPDSSDAPATARNTVLVALLVIALLAIVKMAKTRGRSA